MFGTNSKFEMPSPVMHRIVQKIDYEAQKVKDAHLKVLKGHEELQRAQ